MTCARVPVPSPPRKSQPQLPGRTVHAFPLFNFFALRALICPNESGALDQPTLPRGAFSIRQLTGPDAAAHYALYGSSPGDPMYHRLVRTRNVNPAKSRDKHTGPIFINTTNMPECTHVRVSVLALMLARRVVRTPGVCRTHSSFKRVCRADARMPRERQLGSGRACAHSTVL